MTAHDPIGSDGLTAAERGDFLQRFQSAHDPRVTLTEAEVDRLGPFIWGGWIGVVEEKRAAFSEEMRATVEQIIAARLAPIRALAEEWANPELLTVSGSYRAAEYAYEFADDLRKALDAPQDAPRGPVGGEQGAEVAGGRSEGERAAEVALAQRILARLYAAAEEVEADRSSLMSKLMGPSIAATLRNAAKVVKEEADRA